MKKTLIILVSFVIAMISANVTYAARSQTIGYRVSATVPERPRMINLSDTTQITNLAKRFEIQEEQVLRNNRLVIVKSYTVR